MDAGEYGQRILNKSGAEREVEALRAFEAGEVPAGLLKKTWPVITMKETIDGTPHVLEIPVAPNFFAVGTDESPFFLPIWPTTAQKIATSLYSVLPTRKIADAIHAQANKNISMFGAIPAIEPWYHAGGVPGAIGNSGAWIVANQNRKKIGAARFDVLVDGHGKNVLVAPELDGAYVLIYGGVKGDGGWPLQGLSGKTHVWHYVDYSQLIRFVSRRARLDGKDVDLVNVAKDPKLYALVANAPFDLSFPINALNVGTGAPPAPSSVGGGGGGGGGAVIAPGKPTEWPPKKGAAPVDSSPSVSLAAPLVLGGAALVYFLTR